MAGERIYPALSAVMADVGAIGKNHKNKSQGWQFRGIDDVYNALQGPLAKHKVLVVPEVLEWKQVERVSQSGGALFYTTVKVKYTFYAEDGSNLSACVVGEAMDSGDKSTNKAMSIAMKYALFQVFCIPTEEVAQSDPDNEVHEVQPAQPSEAQTPKKSKAEQDDKKAFAAIILEVAKRDGIVIEKPEWAALADHAMRASRKISYKEAAEWVKANGRLDRTEYGILITEQPK